MSAVLGGSDPRNVPSKRRKVVVEKWELEQALLPSVALNLQLAVAHKRMVCHSAAELILNAVLVRTAFAAQKMRFVATINVVTLKLKPVVVILAVIKRVNIAILKLKSANG